jgi:hypothetical protein
VRRAAAAVAGALLVAGCPIPQPLPDYPPGTITPPRVVVDDSVSSVSEPATVIKVPSGCPTSPTFALGAPLRDSNTIETIVVRWFVNYDPADGFARAIQHEQQIDEVDPADPTRRTAAPWTFSPYEYGAANGLDPRDAGALHVVDMVVSNGFHPAGPLPNRSPAPGFEVQLYRWVFLNVPESGAVPCP